MSQLCRASLGRLPGRLNTHFRTFALMQLPAMFAGLLLGCAPPVSAADAMTFSPCQIQDLNGIGVYNAECTDFAVPENPANPDGRTLKLRVARVPAINRRKEPDPLFLLAGGPGRGATAL